VDEIRRHIGADSLGYLSLEGLLRAARPPGAADPEPGREGFCHACFSGEYPIAVPKDVQVTKLALEETVGADWGRRSGVVEPLPVLARARE
jgi:amidophosphoribosyltransferase